MTLKAGIKTRIKELEEIKKDLILLHTDKIF